MAHVADHEASALAWASVMRTRAGKGGRDACSDAGGLAVLLIGRMGRACTTYVFYAGLRRGVDTLASYHIGVARACDGRSRRRGN